MELRTFITRALLDIVNGVSDAQSESGDARIIPQTNTSLDAGKLGITPYQAINFEVQVRVDESKGSEGKIGVVSSLIGASMAGKSSNESEHTTKLQFSIPVLFATHKGKDKGSS